ncbi:molybdenum cofactor guanylyltransferase [Macrococcoides caseolyticum]|uniref:molybdenum cofactor guanylyltransferase n=1 Tax=Macrococcoides caseolyticum TaxID=69966 RepID=UPI001F31426E|nr:molybdenum cofactor guanylyltransferase [Macrococcus caseolyticus]MCE4956483.1 molybdenum cofactor guanylyltransferase [Macrococcus caseolyticus]
MIGVILAGGKSSRFGSHKSLYPLDEKPFYIHVYHAMKDSGVDRIVLSSNKMLSQYFIDDIEKRGLNIEVIEDVVAYKECGPLSGVYAVMNAIPNEDYCVVSVDTPFVTAVALRYLIQMAGIHSNHHAIVYHDDLQIHRTIAVYRYELLPRVKSSLDSGLLALKVLTEMNTKLIHVNRINSTPFWYENINTKEDLEHVLTLRSGYNGTNQR